MNPYLSHKLKVLTAVLILMVLYIHTYYTEGTQYPALLGLENSVGGGLCTVAVPLFYIISGYLFFLRMPDGIRAIPGKLRKRCRTLLVPYLLANVCTFAFYAALNVVAWRVPAIDGVVNFKVLDGTVAQGLWPTLELVFINPPIAFQLWFVSDLMVVMLFSPLIYAVLRVASKSRARILLLTTVLVVIFAVIGHVRFSAAAIWFTAGGLMATARVKVEYRVQTGFAALLGLLYVAFSVVCGVGALPGQAAHYIPIVGIPAIWTLYDVVAHANPRALSCHFVVFCTRYTFFVYLCHEPLLNIVKKMPLLVSRTEPMLIACYICVPLVFYVIACWVGRLTERCFPRVYKVYTGGR